MHERILRRLDRIDAAAMPQEMNIPALIFMLWEASNPRAIRSMWMGRGASRLNSRTAMPAGLTSNNTT